MYLLLSLLINLNPAMAADFPGCTDWKAERGVSCVFAGKDSKVWKRDCSQAAEEYQCRRGPGNLPPLKACLAEAVCFGFNPGHLESDCSQWVKERGVSCGVDGKPTMWRRACQWEVLPTSACTTFRKNYPTEEDYLD